MNRQHALWVVGAALVAAVVGFAAGRYTCPLATPKVSPPEASRPHATESTHLEMNVVVANVPFWTESRLTWEKLAATSNSTTATFGGPHNSDANAQGAELRSILARGCNGLVVAPADAASVAPILRDYESADVPVITYLIDSPEVHKLTYITSELEQAGERIGRYAVGAVSRKGAVLISYAQAGNPEQEARAKGIRDAVQQTQGFTVLDPIEDKYDEQHGGEQIRALLVQNPNIVAIVGCNSRSAIGAVQALKALNRKAGDVVVTGWDYDNDLLDLIDQGWVAASVAQNTEFMTFLAFELLEGYHEGLVRAKRGITPGAIVPPAQITVPVEVITKETAAAFRRH
ncbi:MAG: sugar ABC transporter substrate-binding protein [Phycisphaerae bacterium]|nr:sugar ABC transporter substrate-binding protein [Phycisphaerae bacterium]